MTVKVSQPAKHQQQQRQCSRCAAVRKVINQVAARIRVVIRGK